MARFTMKQYTAMREAGTLNPSKECVPSVTAEPGAAEKKGDSQVNTALMADVQSDDSDTKLPRVWESARDARLDPGFKLPPHPGLSNGRKEKYEEQEDIDDKVTTSMNRSPQSIKSSNTELSPSGHSPDSESSSQHPLSERPSPTKGMQTSEMETEAYVLMDKHGRPIENSSQSFVQHSAPTADKGNAAAYKPAHMQKLATSGKSNSSAAAKSPVKQVRAAKKRTLTDVFAPQRLTCKGSTSKPKAAPGSSHSRSAPIGKSPVTSIKTTDKAIIANTERHSPSSITSTLSSPSKPTETYPTVLFTTQTTTPPHVLNKQTSRSGIPGLHRNAKFAGSSAVNTPTKLEHKPETHINFKTPNIPAASKQVNKQQVKSTLSPVKVKKRLARPLRSTRPASLNKMSSEENAPAETSRRTSSTFIQISTWEFIASASSDASSEYGRQLNIGKQPSQAMLR